MKRPPLSTVCGVSLLPVPYCYCFAFFYDSEPINFHAESLNVSSLLEVGYWIAFATIIGYYYYYSIKHGKRNSAHKQTVKKLREAKALLELSHLQHQMNPHFLFNSLSILKATAKEEWVKHFALRLAELYRYILDHSLRSDMVSLSEEMNIVYAYLEILDSSHKGNYRLIAELTEEAVKSKVLPLSIQGLIENAFKHNIVSAEWPLQLYIFIENDQVVVSNNINRKKYDTIQNQRQGTGLKNLKERYQIIASKAIEVIESDTTFVVKIPLL